VAARTTNPALAAPPVGSLFTSPKKRTLLLCLGLAAITLLLYNPVTRHEFINFDDDRYITHNPHVVGGLTAQNIIWAFRTTQEANWHPLTWLAHQLDYQVFRLQPAGHHYNSLLLHVANALLLFVLLGRATRSTWRSLVVAALFALHPINVETVAWAAERKNVLCTFFFLLALAAYGWYVRRPCLGRYWPLALAFTMGLMSKPMVITLPFVLLLLDYWPLGRIAGNPAAAAGGLPPVSRQSPSKLILEKVPLLVLSAGSAVITIIAQKSGGAVQSMAQYPLTVRLENAVVAYVSYLRQAIWPAGLAVIYPHPGNSLPGWRIAASALLLVLISAAVLKLRSCRYLAVGWCWFLGTMVPVVGLVQVGRQAMADRYAYIPFIGLFVVLAWGLGDLVSRASHSATPSGGKRIRSYAALAASVYFAALLVISHRQLGYWQDSVTLWSHALAVSGDNFIAHDGIGTALVLRGQAEEAIGHFRAAERLFPEDPISQLNIGAYEQQHGNLRSAVEHYRAGIRLTPDPALQINGLANLGAAYRVLGEYDHARQSYESALRLNPDNPQSLIGMGLLAQKGGDPVRAEGYYAHAMRVQPTDIGLLLLAQALEAEGRWRANA
jgi:tetratricopeptide (TPR) repeat protein